MNVIDELRPAGRRNMPAAPETLGFVPTPPAWMEEASCAGMESETFFPHSSADVAEAIEICAGCPVRGDCLEYALDNHEDHGVWGGRSERERRRIRRQRRRGAA